MTFSARSFRTRAAIGIARGHLAAASRGAVPFMGRTRESLRPSGKRVQGRRAQCPLFGIDKASTTRSAPVPGKESTATGRW